MAIAALIELFITLFNLLILARVLMSWVPNLDPYNPVVQFIHQSTEPVLKPVREALPPMGGFDFSPIIVLILTQMLGQILINILVN